MSIKKKIGNIGPVLILIGIIIGTYSSLITFKEWSNPLMEDVWENRLYFRGACLGFLFVSLGSAATVKNEWYKYGLISLGGGIFSLLFISTLNLLLDDPKVDWIHTSFYFKFTYWGTAIILLVLIFIKILRLCWNKISQFLKFLSSLG